MKQRGNSMVGLLAAAAIILVLVVVILVGPKALGQDDKKVPPRQDGKGQTVVGRAAYAAKDDVCRQQLSQVRQGVQIAADPVEGTFPASLEETRLGSTVTSCPIGKEPYTYDASTGRVSCPHPGHEGY